MLREILNLFSRESLLDQAYSDVITMLKEDDEMFAEAIRSLRRSDTAELRFDFREKDRKINKFEREVRKKVLTHLSVQQGFDVSAALVITSIVIDVERIGDYCKNFADLAKLHPKRLGFGANEDKLVDVERAIERRFSDTIRSLETFDAKLAKGVLDGHTEITKFCDVMVKDMVTGELPGVPPTDYAAAALYLRYLKRIAAHLSNIASSVVNPFHRIGYKPKEQ